MKNKIKILIIVTTFSLLLLGSFFGFYNGESEGEQNNNKLEPKIPYYLENFKIFYPLNKSAQPN